MKTDKALDIIATHISSLDGNVAAHESPSRQKLRQALQALEKFRSAVEVDEVVECYDHDFDVIHELYEFNTKPKLIGTTQTHTLYAVGKEKNK